MTATHLTLQKITKLVAGKKERLFSAFSWDFILNNNNKNLFKDLKKKLRKFKTERSLLCSKSQVQIPAL